MRAPSPIGSRARSVAISNISGSTERLSAALSGSPSTPPKSPSDPLPQESVELVLRLVFGAAANRGRTVMKLAVRLAAAAAIVAFAAPVLAQTAAPAPTAAAEEAV